MPYVTLVSTGFPAGTVPDGTTTEHWTWSELVWAAITVGKRDWAAVQRHGVFSFFEVVSRAATLFASLMATPEGRIKRSGVYNGMDPSEKAATSYFLGLTVAKQLADIRLNVPWLMHLDVYHHQFQAILTGRSRPDLIGTNLRGDWFVFESKGRSGGFSARALDAAKVQATQIMLIAGTAPTMHIGGAGSFL